MSFPPLPKMKWDGFCWSFPMLWPDWKGHRIAGSRIRTSGKPSVAVDFARQAPAEEQIAAYQHLVANQDVTTSKLLSALRKRYRNDRADIFDEEDDELAAKLPPIKTTEELFGIYDLSGIHISQIVKRKYAYVGFSFHCEYDLEHGVGVLTHKSRVVAVGGAEYAFLDWVAEGDL